jgi:predicted small metal-binding protein
MAYKLSCADTGANCPFEVKTETKEELMAHVMTHAKMAHPEMAANPPSPDVIAKIVRQV